MNTPITNTYELVQVGRFLSQNNRDTLTLRQGVKDHRFFRRIFFTDAQGNRINEVCLIETPPDENWEAHNKRLLPVMKALHKSFLIQSAKYHVKERQDGAECLYSKEYNVVIAQFSKGTHTDAKTIGAIFE